MPTISEALAVAIQHHQAGGLREAESIYRQILDADPQHSDAWHLLGVSACQAGNPRAGVECIRRALMHRPNWALAHYNLGNAWEDQGNLDEAAECYRRALTLQPQYPDANFNLGRIFKVQGKLDEAVACYQRAAQGKPDYTRAHYNLGVLWQAQGKLDAAASAFRRAIELDPGLVDAHNDLGNVLKVQGKLDDAEACYQRALRQCPDFAPAHCNLGVVYHDQGKLDQAAACCLKALRLKPDYAMAHYNLGTIFKDQGKLDEAEACYRRALELEPGYAMAHYNLGIVCQDQGKPDQAVACYREAIELQPDLTEAHNNLGNVYHGLGQFEEAVACYGRSLQLQPDYAEAHNNLGNALKDLGKLDEAQASYRRAREAKPDFTVVHSNSLLALQYQSGITLAELAAAHAEYDRLHAGGFETTRLIHKSDRDPHRRLRLGLVSADLCRHPVGYFLIRAIENLGGSQCETVCYYDRSSKDDLTARFQAATVWREVSGLSDQNLAEQIANDRIDILFDLAGHTAHNRLLVFARKPAPVQITWAGYVGTTGLGAMDYILADRHEIPEGAEAFYRENVLRMPDGYVSYDPPAYAPAVTALPAMKQGNVTFGSFNNRVKIDSQTVDLWARILNQVPNSRLLLKFRGMSDPSIVSGLAEQFARFKIAPQRLECLDYSPHPAVLAEYQGVDLALDPLPYNGGLTTCEALWMGVPVVTCPGQTFASRHSLSHLANIGLHETIAATHDEYVDLAVALATDLPRLAGIRAGLRARMAASPLCDGRRFAADLTRVLRDAWQKWCHEEFERPDRRLGTSELVGWVSGA